MVGYLYAAFSLKSAADGDLAESEQAVVDRWRKNVLGIAIEEMGHLGLVNNLLLAVGGSFDPHPSGALAAAGGTSISNSTLSRITP